MINELIEQIGGRERLLQIIDLCGDHNPEVSTLARIALAVLDAKPIGWFTDDYKYDKSATTYSQKVAEMWADKGWPVSEIYATPPATSEPVSKRYTLPPGWKLVPIEPTEDMVISGFESKPREGFSDPDDWDAFEAMSGCEQAAHKARLCYAAMLAAAPTPEQ